MTPTTPWKAGVLVRLLRAVVAGLLAVLVAGAVMAVWAGPGSGADGTVLLPVWLLGPAVAVAGLPRGTWARLMRAAAWPVHG